MKKLFSKDKNETRTQQVSKISILCSKIRMFIEYSLDLIYHSSFLNFAIVSEEFLKLSFFIFRVTGACIADEFR
jgi:hypothetical protein